MKRNLSKELELVHKYCKGCSGLKNNFSSLICNIISFYLHNKQIQIDIIKSCPCNKGCLVKVTCNIICPDWNYYFKKSKIEHERINKEN